jgi:integrase
MTGLHQAVRLYGQHRVANYSLATWAGEAPGLLSFADRCVDEGATTLDELDAFDADAWWAQTKASYQPATADTRLSQLRAFLGWATKKGWLETDPTVFLRPINPAPKLRERLDARGLLDLIEAADFPQHRIILALCANLAVRQAELKRLLIGDVDRAAGTIAVRVTKTKDTPPDLMPITADLDVELQRWTDHYRAAVPGLTRADHLVPAQHVGAQGITYHPGRTIAEPEDVVKRALGRLGWTEEETKGEGIHLIRRSVARIFFDAAEAEESYHEALLGTMRLLHHDRSETTLRYIGVDRQTLARDRFLRGKPFLTRLAAAPKLTAVSA